MKDLGYEIILLNFQVAGFPGHLHQDFLGGLGLYHLPVKFKRGVTSSGLDRGPPGVPKKGMGTGIFSEKKQNIPGIIPKLYICMDKCELCEPLWSSNDLPTWMPEADLQVY